MFIPDWIKKGDGTIDEEKIREYWEEELADFITWEEVKKYIFDPLVNHAFSIVSTTHYDQSSIMNWPFYYKMANNIEPVYGDADYIAELSNQDKEFINKLYGPRIPEISIPSNYIVLAEYIYTGTTPSFTLSTTDDIFVIWDAYDIPADLATFIDLPTDTTTLYTTTVTYIYDSRKERKIQIAQLKKSQIMETSNALKDFNITMGRYAKNINIKPTNYQLERVTIRGGSDFTPQLFNFTDFLSLRELYLVEVLDSRVILKDCEELRRFGTSPYIWTPDNIRLQPSRTIIISDDLTGEPIQSLPPPWPEVAQRYHSLSDVNGTPLTITGCPNINAISLEHTRIDSFYFSNLPNLEYLYISSQRYYITSSPSGRGDNLWKSLYHLPQRSPLAKGNIVVRGIFTPVITEPPLYYFWLNYVPVEIRSYANDYIDWIIYSTNWNIVWDSGLKLDYRSEMID